MASVTSILFAALYSIIVVFNIAGNILVIYIILTNKVKKTATNYLLFNMAAADLLVGTFAAPKYIASPSYSSLNNTDLKCRYLISTNISWLAAASSSVTMVALSIERYYAVCKPYKFRRTFRLRNVKAMVALSWVYGIITNAYSFKYNECENGSFLSQNVREAFAILFFIEGFVFLSVMAYLVYKTSRALWFSRQELGRNQPSELVRHKNTRKITRAAMLVIASFIVCWIPEKSTCLLSVLVDSNSSLLVYGMPLTGFLVSVNASLDPYLFSFQGRSFQIYLKKIICCYGRSYPLQPSRNLEMKQIHLEIRPNNAIQTLGFTQRDSNT